jgi:hypothetical protein
MSEEMNKHEIKSFLGICSYYRRFNSGFANVAKLLTKLTEKKQAFQSTPALEASSKQQRRPSALPLFLLSRSQQRGLLLTQMRIMLKLEE